MDSSRVEIPTTRYAGDSTVASAKKSLDTNDFFRLIAAQLSHQDVLNPSGGTEFIAQMAQFSSLQTMENSYGVAKSQLDMLDTLLQMTYTQYGAGLVGKEVLVASAGADGKYAEQTGVVERVSLGGTVPAIWVGGKSYPLSSVMEVRAATEGKDQV